jgi:sigma-B regulation protein RsbU (phosphoserine phosphatase)
MITATPVQDLLAIEKLREQELEEARIIQDAMLPVRTLYTENVIVSHEFQPVTEVGGDYLDYFNLSDDTVGLYIGDVSGKGLPAALYAALAVGTLRGVHKTGQDPSHVLHLLNERLHLRGIPARHTALQYALFDPSRAELQMSSAGMLGPLLLRGKECRVIQLTGVPPGLYPSVNYDQFTLPLEPGDSLLFCTDGLIEAHNVHGAEFGLAGLQDVCRRHASDSPLDLLGHVFSTIQEFTVNCRQEDDMTATVFHYAAR